MATDIVRIGRALLSVSDKTGLLDLARALKPFGVDFLSTGGHGRGAGRRRLRRRRRGAGHRLSGDDGRPAQDAAPAGARRSPGDPIRAGASGGDDRQRHRADRPPGRQSLSVRSDAEAGRLVRGQDREHRYRRPGDDPRRGQEPRRCRRHRRRGRLSRADRRIAARRGNDQSRVPPQDGAEGLRAHRGL